MIHKLELKHRVMNREDVAYAVNEIRKAKETLRELVKDKDKYKDKIRMLSQHIHYVRKQTELKEKFEGTLSRKKPRGFVNKFELEHYEDLHEILRESKQIILNNLKDLRRKHKNQGMEWSIYGIKRYLKFGGEEKGYVFLKAGTILELLKSKMVKKIKDAKAPKGKENHIGVEIEFASFLSEGQIGQIFLDADLIDYVQLQEEFIDGRDGQEKPYELCVIAPEKEIFDIIRRVCEVLNEKIDANITYGCGLHVHIDARNRNIRKMFDNLFNCQEILYSMVAHTRRSNRHVQMMNRKVWMPPKGGFAHTASCKEEKCYCKFNGKEDFKNKAMRYYGLNTWSYISHNTMEIRIHSGTANAVKINNWIKVLLAIVDGKPIKTYLKGVDDFKEIVDLEPKLLDYVEKRTEYFKQEII